ncbi:F-box/LRR-repeat protein At3g58900 [Lactuca sativa]|uniref:F-box domain-containing protein n=1 Tax=Lactuca sativa TaxID=4236 RepID=A0A9R1UWR2_LACSA|nr:F-box/LRR-repeat protein At3g58900 [Lactuca sativa]KAJ0194684.1 hypothetical protein LSAT_V11C700347190 [Lactuca sativa]
MENSKQSRTSKDKDGVDMFSKLPEPILHLILSHLQGTEEVIRTSILSRRWRNLWTSVPSIDIDYSRRLNPYQGFKKNNFEEFVSRVLENNSLDLDSFRLSCANYCNMSIVKQWIDAAVKRNVKVLDLMFCIGDEYDEIELPNSLMTCDSLEVLRLYLFGRCLHLPYRCKGFSRLRVIELNDMMLFDGGLVTDLLKKCPLLEDLKLKKLVFGEKMEMVDGDFHSSIQISCPKLVFLELTSYLGKFNFTSKGLNSLKKAVINLNGSLPELMRRNICELFAGISHVESLSLNPFTILKCIDAASLPNLKTVELRITMDDFPMDDLIQTLQQYPRLEALHLIIQDVFSYQRRNSWQSAHLKLNEVEARRILTRHLRRVEFVEFNGENPSLLMARSLLMYGDALEEMVFSWGDKDKYPRKSMETLKKMSKYRKASSTVKLITLLRE